jgi:hypothetical protein
MRIKVYKINLNFNFWNQIKLTLNLCLNSFLILRYVVRKVSKDTNSQLIKFTDKREAYRLIDLNPDDKNQNIFSAASVPKN